MGEAELGVLTGATVWSTYLKAGAEVSFLFHGHNRQEKKKKKKRSDFWELLKLVQIYKQKDVTPLPDMNIWRAAELVAIDA